MHTMFRSTSGESLGSGRPGAGHVQGSREEQMGAHSGYLLAPPMFWACVLSLVISDLFIFCLHLLTGDWMICDLVGCAMSVWQF